VSAQTKRIRVRQFKSVIGSPADQKATVRALGLKRINHTVDHDDTAVIRGMVFKVKHLVEVEDI